MKQIFILILLFLLFELPGRVLSQGVGIGTLTPNASAKLDVNSSTQGTLITRMTTPQRRAITTPATGLLVYDTDKKTIYMYDGSKWLPLLFTSDENKLPLSSFEAGDGMAGDFFGTSLAINGDYAIIGSPNDDVNDVNDQGSAYIFLRVSGAWLQQAKLIAADGGSSDYFGTSVGINETGDEVAIGATWADVGGNLAQGAVYIFSRTGQVWSQVAKLTASDGEIFDLMGNSVSIAGNYVLAGVSADDIGLNGNQGSVYVFYKGTGWVTGQAYQAKLTASDGNADDNFGWDVSLSGDYALIGSQHDDNIGSAFIFGRIGTSWVQLAKLTPGDGVYPHLFGFSVSLDGDYAIIGALDTQVSGVDVGAAYIYYRGSGWTTGQPFQAKLTASDGASGDDFGAGVSISGTYAIVGARSDDVGSHTNQGTAFVYKREGTTWNLLRRMDDEKGQASSQFGSSVGIHGFNVLVGAPQKNSNRGEIQFLNIE